MAAALYYSHQQRTKIAISSRCQHLLPSDFFSFFFFFGNDHPKKCEVALHYSLLAWCSSRGPQSQT